RGDAGGADDLAHGARVGDEVLAQRLGRADPELAGERADVRGAEQRVGRRGVVGHADEPSRAAPAVGTASAARGAATWAPRVPARPVRRGPATTSATRRGEPPGRAGSPEVVARVSAGRRWPGRRATGPSRCGPGASGPASSAPPARPGRAGPSRRPTATWTRRAGTGRGRARWR